MDAPRTPPTSATPRQPWLKIPDREFGDELTAGRVVQHDDVLETVAATLIEREALDETDFRSLLEGPRAEADATRSRDVSWPGAPTLAP